MTTAVTLQRGELTCVAYLRESHVDEVESALQPLGDHHPAAAWRAHGSK